MDAIHGAYLDAGRIFDVCARLRNYVGHCVSLLNSICCSMPIGPVKGIVGAPLTAPYMGAIHLTDYQAKQGAASGAHTDRSCSSVRHRFDTLTLISAISPRLWTC